MKFDEKCYDCPKVYYGNASFDECGQAEVIVRCGCYPYCYYDDDNDSEEDDNHELLKVANERN
jgi:hypothetical protein